jgi:hypothetical protein
LRRERPSARLQGEQCVECDDIGSGFIRLHPDDANQGALRGAVEISAYGQAAGHAQPADLAQVRAVRRCTPAQDQSFEDTAAAGGQQQC